MKKTVVINVVGLSKSIIGDNTPFLQEYLEGKRLSTINPMLPALTTVVQSTYLTGKWPSEHGIIGNGWFDKKDDEIKFWKQSNKLVLADKIWDRAKKENANFTCANICWWYNMYSNADYTVTPRPNYLADGVKIPDCYSKPPELRAMLQHRLGPFPLFQFWGPGANIKSTKWIVDASIYTDERFNPTLTLVYLPHLDYCLQKFVAGDPKLAVEFKSVDQQLKKLVEYYEHQHAEVIILSEYGIAPVESPIHINRILRRAGLLNIRVERGLEILDAGESEAFAVADHQVANVYLKNADTAKKIRKLLSFVPGVAMVLDKEQQKAYNLDHERSGDYVIVAKQSYWFTYYYWIKDNRAPDFARCVDIHKKPGYDPVELFMTSKAKAIFKLFLKKIGFRYIMNVIPLNASLVKGSHGSIDSDEKYHPVIISKYKSLPDYIKANEVYEIIWNSLFPALEQGDSNLAESAVSNLSKTFF